MNPFDFIRFSIGGWTMDTIKKTNPIRCVVHKNELQNRAGTDAIIPVCAGTIKAKAGYEISAHTFTASKYEAVTISTGTNVYGYTDPIKSTSEYNWASEAVIDSETKYITLSIRKTSGNDFAESELASLYGTAFEFIGDTRSTPIYDAFGDTIKESGVASTVVIAAYNSSIKDKRIADIVCDGSHDEIDIQRAIDSFGDSSGVIQLCNGTYNIDSFIEHDGYYYGLYLEHRKREIIIRGVTHNHKANNSSWDSTDKCALIYVTPSAYASLNSSNESYVIGSNRLWEFPYKVLGVEDLTIALPDNTKPVIGIDGMYLADLHVYRCFFRTEGTYTDDVNINPKCIAIRGCPGGQIGYNYSFEHIKIIGWGTGLQVNGEASTIIDVQTQRAAYGFVFGNIDELNPYPRSGGIHPSVMIDCGASYCAKSIVVFGTGNRNTIEIIAFNCEEGGDNWAVPGSILWEAEHLFEYRSNGTMMGSVTYALVDAVGGWLPNPINIWGDDHSADPYFRTTDLRARTKGTTAERPEDPCFMSKYYDTTIEKFIMFNGTDWVEIS